jgi:hypothetical protein
VLKKFAAAGIITAAAAGVMLLAGPANADTNTNGTGNVPVVVPINVPVNTQVPICGNSVADVVTAGDNIAACEGNTGIGQGNDQSNSGY